MKMEMDRRENDRHIAVLYHTMVGQVVFLGGSSTDIALDGQSDLLFVLSYLDPVFNDADNLKSMLASQLQAITKTMNDFGMDYSGYIFTVVSILRILTGNFCEFVLLSIHIRQDSLIPPPSRVYYKHKTVGEWCTVMTTA